MSVLCAITLPSIGECKDNIKIASIFAKTGAASDGGKAAIKGIRFAVLELNQQGGLLGKQIEIIELDNHSKALHSKKAAQQAVKIGVVAVFGATWSSLSLAMAPILQAAYIPMISPYSTNPAVTKVGNFIFRACFIDPFQGRIMANFATQDLKAKTAGIMINVSSRYSEGLAAFFRKYFIMQGGTVLQEVNYIPDAQDFKPDLLKIIQHQPDVLFIPGYALDSSRIIVQAKELGLSATLLGGDGWGTPMYIHAGSALNGSYYSGHWHEDVENPKSKHFLKNYQKVFGEIDNEGAALSYDAFLIFAKAVRRARTLEPFKLREALAATKNFNGVTGRISFNQNGDPIKPAVISKFGEKSAVYVKTVEP